MPAIIAMIAIIAIIAIILAMLAMIAIIIAMLAITAVIAVLALLAIIIAHASNNCNDCNNCNTIIRHALAGACRRGGCLSNQVHRRARVRTEPHGRSMTPRLAAAAATGNAQCTAAKCGRTREEAMWPSRGGHAARGFDRALCSGS